MKVLLLSHFFYTTKGPVHGPADSVKDYLARNKISYSYIAHPLHSGRKSFLEINKNGKVEIQSFGTKIKLPLVVKSLLELLQTHLITKNDDYDLAIAVDPLNALSALLLRRLGKCKKVVFYTADYAEKRFENQLFNYVYHILDKFALRYSDFVWNVSTRILKKRLEQGIIPSKNLYVPNTPSFSMVKNLPINQVDRFKVMMVVGKTHSPILSKVISVFRKVKKQYPKAKLVLIGPQNKKDVDKNIKNLGLQNSVERLGQIKHEDLLNILKTGGIGLALYTQDFPWTYYGDSMKAREYMACGLPVIISDIVSTAEDIKENNAGIVVKPNALEIERAINKLLGDKNFWQETRNNAINAAKKYDLDKILEDVFERVTKKEKQMKSIAIVTHGDIRGPAHEIRDYLRPRSFRLLFISHPLLFIKKNFALSSFYELYDYGDLVLKKGAYHWRLSEPSLYVKDFLYTIIWCIRNSKKIDLFIGSGNLNAFAGLILKKIGKVEKVVFYCIDYIPYRFENEFLNNLYHFVDKVCAEKCDLTWNLSRRMILGRENKWKKKFQNQIIVPHGLHGSFDTSKNVIRKFNRYEIVFIGTLLKKQGVQLIIRTLPRLVNRFPKVRLNVIGTGEYKTSLVKLAATLGVESHVTFTGYQPDKKLEKIMSRAHVAVAPYREKKSNFSYYGDPGKVKSYLSLGLPVIITEVPAVASDLEKYKCGLVINYSEDRLIGALERFFLDLKFSYKYRKNALKFASRFTWEKIYQEALRKTI